MEEVLGLLRGPVGTNVEVLFRRGKQFEFTKTLTRARIEVPAVKYAMMEDGIAYLRIIEFTPLTAARVQDALDSFKKAGYSKLIIDLRNNPGGLIDSAVEVSNKFIKSGVIVSTKARVSYENREFRARPGRAAVPEGLPIVVLLNKASASASEIVAGALKDYRVAYLMGEKSYGKGSVQQVINLLHNDAMKLTMARYYTPSGANIDKLGIPPDREVLMPTLTEAEEKLLSELLQTTRISDFMEGRKDLSSQEADTFVAELYKTWPVQHRVLKKMVMLEYYRTHLSPLYDLEYDVQLQAAVDLLKKENVSELLKTTKTVKELQEAPKP
jgi:carboxyl-terminal processing protease